MLEAAEGRATVGSVVVESSAPPEAPRHLAIVHHVSQPSNPSVTEADVLAIAPRTLMAEVDGRLVVVDQASGRSALLNATGALVVTAIDGVASLRQVLDRVAAELGGNRASLRTETFTVIDQLVGQELVRHTEDSLPKGPPWSAPDPKRRRKRIDVMLANHTWAYSCRVRVGATTVRVRSDEPTTGTLLAQLLSALPSASDVSEPNEHSIAIVSHPVGAASPSTSVPGRSQYRVVADGRVVGRRDQPEGAVALALHYLDALSIEAASNSLLFHAGAAEEAGLVVMVFGDSGAGKSTLTAALVRNGFGYLTDEVGVVDPGTLDVTPYPKALDLHPNSLELLDLDGPDVVLGSEKHKVFPQRLGDVSAGGRLGLMVFLGGSPSSTSGTQELSLSPADALMKLLPVTFGTTLQTDSHLEAMARMCEQVPAIHLPRRALTEALAVTQDAFAQSP